MGDATERAAVAASPPTAYDTIREEGKKLFAAGEYERALRVYRRGLREGQGGGAVQAWAAAASPARRVSAGSRRRSSARGENTTDGAACEGEEEEAEEEGMLSDTQRVTLQSNVAACLLQLHEAAAGAGGALGNGSANGSTSSIVDTRGVLIECVAVCSDVLDTDPRHRKARWRRARANHKLGYACVAAVDLRLLCCITAAASGVSAAAKAEAEDELAGILASDAFKRASDGLHRTLCADNAASALTEKTWGAAELDAFFANGGEVALAYLLTSACVRPALDGLLVLRYAVEENVADVVDMEVLMSCLPRVLENDTGRMVKEYAGDCLAYIVHHLAEQTDGANLVQEFLDRFDVWPSVVHLIATGLAVRQAMNLARLVVKHLGPARASGYVQMFCVGATLLWRNPTRAPLDEDVIDSLNPGVWGTVATALANEALVESMKDDLIQLAKYKEAIVSSDAATLIGVIEEILHPEDHCRMEPIRMPVSATTDWCAACGAGAPQARCEYCLLTLYCGEACQAADWHRHGRWCGERERDASRDRRESGAAR